MSKTRIPFQNWRAELSGTERACILVDHGAERFHIWVHVETLEIERAFGSPGSQRVLYANPIDSASKQRTRSLDAEAAAHADTVAEMLRRAPALIHAARHNKATAEAEATRQAEEGRRIGMIERAGPALLAALEPLAMAARAQADALEKEAMLMNSQPRDVILGAARRWRGLEDEARRAIWQAAHGERPMSDDAQWRDMVITSCGALGQGERR